MKNVMFDKYQGLSPLLFIITSERKEEYHISPNRCLVIANSNHDEHHAQTNLQWLGAHLPLLILTFVRKTWSAFSLDMTKGEGGMVLTPSEGRVSKLPVPIKEDGAADWRPLTEAVLARTIGVRGGVTLGVGVTYFYASQSQHTFCVHH